MAYTFDKAHATAPTPHHTQYFEMISNRGIYHDGWYANTTPPHGPWILNAPLPDPTDYKWELYNLNDLASTSSFTSPAAVVKRTRRFCRHAATQRPVNRWVLPVPHEPET
jgi:arylsulfatase A-like enzyme